MIFRTSSGSRYELDVEKKRIRRLGGLRQATSRQGPDGEWKSFFQVFALEKSKYVAPEIVAGTQVVILWEAVALDDIWSHFPGTMTSQVVEIEQRDGILN